MALPSQKSVVVPQESTPVQVQEKAPSPTIILSAEDAYIRGRMAAQPQSLDEIRKVVVHTDGGANRLRLPRHFESYSYDCSIGPGCHTHQWKQAESVNEIPGQWSFGNRGEFIFRWVKKHKRAFDEAMNAKGWVTVNRRQFPDAPDHLFTANGGIEEGDMVLFILPAKQALALRAAPGKRSMDAVRSRVTRTASGDALMTGNPNDERFYAPQGGGEDDESSTGIQEGRDF